MTSDFISKDLCEFVGAVIGDGHLWTDGSRFKIGITGDPKLDRTYSESDGTVFFSKKTYSSSTYPTIEICTYSVGLANQLTSMLVEQGFRARMRGSYNRGFYGHYMETRCSKNGLMKWGHLTKGILID